MFHEFPSHLFVTIYISFQGKLSSFRRTCPKHNNIKTRTHKQTHTNARAHTLSEKLKARDF